MKTASILFIQMNVIIESRSVNLSLPATGISDPANSAIMDIDDVGGDIGMSARIPAAGYKSLIRISVERSPLGQMDATVDLNYYSRPARAIASETPNDSKVLCKLTAHVYIPRCSATGCSPPLAIVMTKQILRLPRVVP